MGDQSPPAWLTMEQALSWVLYRDHDLPPELGFYGEQYSRRKTPRIGKPEELEVALQSGELRAREQHRNGEFREIDPLEWMTRRLTPLYAEVTVWISRKDLLREFKASASDEQASNHHTSDGNASYISSRMPSDDQILAKADAMKSEGYDSYKIAKEMRHEPGFERVSNGLVRELIRGRWPPGRPRKKADA